MKAEEAAEKLASGQIRFDRNCECDEWVAKATRAGRARVSPEAELFLWECFELLAKELAPKCRFNKDGICNGQERKRRNALFGLIRLVDFRSQDPKIKRIFQEHFGQISLSWMMTVCGHKAAPFHYEWAFEAIRDISAKIWGPKALDYLKNSPEHMEVFRKLAPEKFNLLAVKRVMES